jgi:hypothetical protein
MIEIAKGGEKERKMEEEEDGSSSEVEMIPLQLRRELAFKRGCIKGDKDGMVDSAA